MPNRNAGSLFFIYLGMLATSLSVIALGLTAVVKASAGLSQAGAREKTLLELQVDSSRDIRRALAVPVSHPPLAPITARPARDLREIAASQAKNPPRTKPSPAAMSAMAMDQSGALQSAQPVSREYALPDRHAIY
jgi:hypothetical protein